MKKIGKKDFDGLKIKKKKIDFNSQQLQIPLWIKQKIWYNFKFNN